MSLNNVLRVLLLGLVMFTLQARAIGSEPELPRIYLWVTQSNSGEGYGGMAKKVLAKEGWRGVERDVIRPQLEWLGEAFDEPIGVIVHLPFGHYGKFMAIDAWDAAAAGRYTYFLDDLDEVWKPLSRERECIAYVGGLHLPLHLRNRPASELGPMVERTMTALHCFSRTCIDTSGAAYTHHFVTPSGYVCETNNEHMSLSIADAHFGHRSTMVEATPRNHPFVKQLWSRDAFIIEPTFRARHGLPGERRKSAEAEGFGDTDYITKRGGRICRAVTSGYFKGDTKVTIKACQRVLREGDVLVLAPRAIIAAGHSAAELLAP